LKAVASISTGMSIISRDSVIDHAGGSAGKVAAYAALKVAKSLSLRNQTVVLTNYSSPNLARAMAARILSMTAHIAGESGTFAVPNDCLIKAASPLC
jgi:hypothetical protein